MNAFADGIEDEGSNKRDPARGKARRVAVEAGRRSFLRLVSHELRTPLNAIIGFSEIIAQELHGPIGDQRYRDYAELVNESGLKLLKLINDVIEIARLEAGVADLSMRPEDPSSAVEEAAESIMADARARGVHLDIQSTATLPVEADHRGLIIALAHLLQNAIAHSSEGASVRVRIRPVDHMTAIEVDDDGPCVPNQDGPRLGRPTDQAVETVHRHGDGAGLGLPITRLLVEKMGGRLRLTSTPGSGLSAAVLLRTAVPPSADKIPIVGASP